MLQALLIVLLAMISFAADISPMLFQKSFNLTGTFHPYNFYSQDHPKSAFNWVFRTPDGKVYQMMGTAPSQENVFGWKPVYIPHITKPVWDFYYIGDLDRDGDSRFDYILVASEGPSRVYRLLPTPPGSFFEYEDLGYFNYQKDEEKIVFDRGNVRYIGIFKSFQDNGLPKSLGVVGDVRDYNLSSELQKALQKVDMSRYNVALFYFSLSGAAHFELGTPQFRAPGVVFIPTGVAMPEVGIMNVIYYTVAIACSKDIQRVVFELTGKEFIVNFTTPKPKCEDEPPVPVCGLKEVQCVMAPCEPVMQSYPNYCSLVGDGAKYLHMGSCEVNATTDAKAIAKSVAKIGGDLMHKLYSDHNILLSPFSIFTALNMVYFGATDETKEEFRSFFDYADGIDIPSSVQEFLKSVTPKANTLEVANSAWFEKEFKVYKSYEAMVREFLLSEVYRKDFIHHYDKVREEINRWVEQKTHEKIQNLLPKGSLNPYTRAVLVNAVYFLGEWMYAFEKSQTKKEPFHLLSGETKMVDMMHNSAPYAISEAKSFRAIEIPYKAEDNTSQTEGELSMWVLLPKKRIEDVLCQLCDEGMAFIAKKYYPEGGVELKMPKFTFDWGVEDITKALQESGLKKVFDPYGAELFALGKPIQPGENLYVSAVFHKTFIEVNEKGSEAAAATAVISEVAGMPPKPLEFFVDRPFVFMIVENRYHTPLFYGVVVEP